MSSKKYKDRFRIESGLCTVDCPVCGSFGEIDDRAQTGQSTLPHLVCGKLYLLDEEAPVDTTIDLRCPE